MFVASPLQLLRTPLVRHLQWVGNMLRVRDDTSYLYYLYYSLWAPFTYLKLKLDKTACLI